MTRETKKIDIVADTQNWEKEIGGGGWEKEEIISGGLVKPAIL